MSIILWYSGHVSVPLNTIYTSDIRAHSPKLPGNHRHTNYYKQHDDHHSNEGANDNGDLVFSNGDSSRGFRGRDKEILIRIHHHTAVVIVYIQRISPKPISCVLP